MRKLILNLLPVIACLQLSAQNLSNPYASIGKKAPKIATVTNGEYEEFFKQDTLVQIGTTVMNRYTGEVAFFEEDNSEKFKQFTEHSEKNSRFLSIDPLTRKYPYLTPYQFASNTPIQATDIDGLEMYYAADGSLIGKIGDNTKVRLVNDKDVKAVTSYITWANNTKVSKYQLYATSKANQFSCDVGLTNEEMNTRAFLGTITKLEGGAYNRKIGGGTFEGDEHPGGQKLRFGSTKKYVSAAGAYQITEGTYEGYKKADGDVTNFSPENQDRIAVDIIDAQKALGDVKAGNIDAAISKLKSQWSSLPGASEETHNSGETKTIFKGQVSKELQNNSPVATPQGKLDVE